MNSHLAVFTVLLVYRLIPWIIETVLAIFVLTPEALRRGFLADSQALIATSQERFGEVWPRWVELNIKAVHAWPLVWLDNQVLKVWPWLWPLWIGPKIAIQKRVFRSVMDDWWRR